MKVLPRLLALAALVSCSSNDGPAAALVVAINTGDLILPDDAGTVGLYLTQIDQDGRKRSVLAHEEKVTIVDGQPSVTFPGSLVVESHGEPARLLARFVAFRKDTREALTMREARAAVPTDRQALLRLNLFFTNAGNVIDDRAGEPVLSSDEPGLTLQQAADNVDPYARFRSVCDGATAADGQTSGDDGRCVPLDVTPEPRDPNAPMPGRDPDAGCYDLDETFRTKRDVVRTLENLVLPESGECRIPLPGRFDAARLNVAIEGTTGFPSLREAAGASELRLRPLAAGLAFRIDPTDNTIVVSQRACKALRDHKVLFSQRTTAWAGGEPVCSPWSSATKRGSFDDTPPTELPDASGPQGLTVEAPSEEASFRQLAVHEGELALTFGAQSGGGQVLRFDASTFEAGGVVNDPAPAGLAGSLSAPTFLAVPNGAGGTTVELYVLANEPSLTLHHAMRRGVLTPVQKITDGGPAIIGGAAVAMVGGVPSAFWFEGPQQQPDGTLGAFTDPTHVAETARRTGATSGSLAIGTAQTAVRGNRWVVGQQTIDGGSWWKIDVPQGEPSVVEFVSSRARYNVPFSTRVADRLIGFGYAETDASERLRGFDYESDSEFETQLVPASAVPTDAGFCFTTIFDRTRQADVQCMTLAQLQQNAPGHVVVVGGIGHPQVAGDGQHLYVAYTCGGPTGPVHVDRLPLGDVYTKTLVSRCL